MDRLGRWLAGEWGRFQPEQRPDLEMRVDAVVERVDGLEERVDALEHNTDVRTIPKPDAGKPPS